MHATSRAEHIPPDTAIASSPLLREPITDPRQPIRERPKVTQAESFRLSRDLAKLRWDGTELQEDDLREVDCEDKAYEYQSVTGDFDADMDHRAVDSSQDDLDAASYSTLSKRADFILAHAKRKLNLLEGNLGKARHSLSSPHSIPGPRTTSSLSNYASPEAVDESDGAVKTSPRFNFATPRHLRTSPGARSPSGHLRMFSDTSVPSPGGATIKGSRSLDYIQRGDLPKHPASPLGPNATLNTVAEQEETNDASVVQDLRELYSASSPPPKSTHELRDQAEELRSRIAFLQKRSKHAAPNGQPTIDSGSDHRTEQAFLTQVESLKESLEAQEAVIEQMENAEHVKRALPEDPRGEWQQVLESNQARADGDNFSEDEYFEDEDDILPENLPDVLGEEEFDEMQSMAAAHEDRADAFDYETFILHSAMGRGVDRSSSPVGSAQSEDLTSNESEGSVTTEKGFMHAGNEAQTTSGEEQNRNWEAFQQSNESMTSLTTMQSFETANEEISSDSGSDGSEQQHEDLLRMGLQHPWPMPPQPTNGNVQRSMLSEHEVPTPKAGSFPRGQSAVGFHQGRPLSNIFQTLLVPEDSSELPRTLDKADMELIRRCADSLRSVCLEAIHPTTSPRDMKALRERLEVAKRVLNGEL